MSDPFDDQFPPRLVAEGREGDNAAPLSVGELSLKLKRMVEGEFGHVRLRGEISGFKRAASGHVYLALKDADAVIDAVMWRGQADRLPFRPQDGIEVVATGKLTTYPGRSKYQIVIERMELAGEGALMALLEKLKAQLAGEGLFDPARKQPLPFAPQTIGVVTSPTGAVIRDILHRLADRFPTHVLVWPVKVQGEGAAAEVAAAVRGFDAMPADGPVRRPDLVIVARGGGSIEDLWAFNEEVVVRAVAACSIPIISAVGHETDTTLCDHAADVRAPTPTAAAEIAVPVRVELANAVATMGLRAERYARRYHERAGERLAALVRVLPRRDALLGPQRQKADDLGAKLDRALERRVTAARGVLDRAAGALRPAVLERKLDTLRHRLDGAGKLLDAVNPDNLLQRGYVRVGAKASGKVVASAADARAAGAVTLHFRDGIVDARVERSGAKSYAGDKPEQPDLF
ncbi:exodeoxyribonuclease VII large subunit [Sphingomonas koreensis]|jgi:exodeoxyribonuclease VII large subunit|uniref:Exodeoxyribonuclease 7 large subunit n=1 Tax=Sphingomonas koreensis TaxID=93064 RepID=A0A1L6J8Y2_9SPHN|nr:exodeoxyribonuclease VII large subunit [Sphingomonas koreensis]APR52365.1 exodeoxyribonuclease VII large subunit [Sphingomonas koreensis]MDC7811517.1 exodeoxyribonuclease VII large subunit [Sphingomonas koreensis]RSU19745.1 exodeoxyribonuclease VII large subunit [Sphingomonas koreensis]RSU26533.1 exodeoxyribonuclease VII large subunit [Sphingomonas koreensis]RSU27315.1 exodeoxyribonuclease VII large subunit [Sphingomonas koreensis]